MYNFWFGNKLNIFRLELHIFRLIIIYNLYSRPGILINLIARTRESLVWINFLDESPKIEIYVCINRTLKKINHLVDADQKIKLHQLYVLYVIRLRDYTVSGSTTHNHVLIQVLLFLAKEKPISYLIIIAKQPN